jgi:hypothetical protein
VLIEVEYVVTLQRSIREKAACRILPIIEESHGDGQLGQPEKLPDATGWSVLAASPPSALRGMASLSVGTLSLAD